jgi:hypothetical protein
MISANMAAFLTMSQISSPIKSIADLGAQNKIKYGTVKNSRAAEFFKNSKSEIYQKMWTQMNEVDPESMVHSSKEGPKKVRIRVLVLQSDRQEMTNERTDKYQ